MPTACSTPGLPGTPISAWHLHVEGSPTPRRLLAIEKRPPNMTVTSSGLGTASRLGVRRRSPSAEVNGFLSTGGTERAIVDGVTNLRQKIGPASRPLHLLRFIHAAVHQKIGRPFGVRSADAQARAMAFSVIHRPGALAGVGA
jgi:hypothetical protein